MGVMPDAGGVPGGVRGCMSWGSSVVLPITAWSLVRELDVSLFPGVSSLRNKEARPVLCIQLPRAEFLSCARHCQAIYLQSLVLTQP